MARLTFGGTGGDFVVSSTGAPMPGDTGTVWTARTGGSQVTDLRDVSGNALATSGVIVAGSYGEVIFQGPDDGGATTALWVDFGGGVRVLVKPTTATGGGGGSGTVTSVTAGNGTITVAGTATDPTIAATVGTTSGTVAAGDDSRITGAVQKSTATTKGDLLVATGSAAIARVGVGTNDYVLTADSTQTAGVKWAAAAAGGVTSVNSETGAVTLTTDDISDSGQTNKWTTSGDISKLSGIEAGADVTDATNVAAAGAVMATLADAKGDLIVATAADTLTRLAVGTNDYVLTADSAQATGVKWAAASGGSGIAATLLDAKGDLIAASAADTAARLAVGSAGTFLFPDSGAATGLTWGRQWATPLSGNYFTSQFVVGNSTRSTTLNRLYFLPIMCFGTAVDRIGIRIQTGGTTGAVVRLGLYAPAADGRPGALLFDAGTVDATGTGTDPLITISQTLPVGLAWMCAVSQVATCSLRFSTVYGNPAPPLASGDTTVFVTPGANYYYVDSVSGALPSSPTIAYTGNSDSGTPLMAFRAA